jgi:hypothetical protein
MFSFSTHVAQAHVTAGLTSDSCAPLINLSVQEKGQNPLLGGYRPQILLLSARCAHILILLGCCSTLMWSWLISNIADSYRHLTVILSTFFRPTSL